MVSQSLLVFLTSNILSKCYFNIITLHQPKLTPGSETKEGTCGLNRKATSDMQKDKPSLAENPFDIYCHGWTVVSI
jgi:hypothetical protein